MNLEITPVIGLDKDLQPVTNYKDAVHFEGTDHSEEDSVVCYSLYNRLGNGEARHIADFCNMEDAENVMEILLGTKLI